MIEKKKTILDNVWQANRELTWNQKHTKLPRRIKAVEDRSLFNQLKKDLLKIYADYDQCTREWGREVEMDTLLMVAEKLLRKGIRPKDVNDVTGIPIDDIKLWFG